eukprot:10041296-Lingulodinium_polyedra.AAC.1
MGCRFGAYLVVARFARQTHRAICKIARAARLPVASGGVCAVRRRVWTITPRRRSCRRWKHV